MSRPEETPSPWYRHFWPWFIVVLMVLSVAASLWTVVIAHRHRDVEVGRAPRVDARVSAVIAAVDPPSASGVVRPEAA